MGPGDHRSVPGDLVEEKGGLRPRPAWGDPGASRGGLLASLPGSRSIAVVLDELLGRDLPRSRPSRRILRVASVRWFSGPDAMSGGKSPIRSERRAPCSIAGRR